MSAWDTARQRKFRTQSRGQSERARKVMKPVSLKDNTIPHDVRGEFDGGIVLLRPASPGTGVIAGGGVRAVLEAVGIKDVLSKSLGSNNDMAMVNATPQRAFAAPHGGGNPRAEKLKKEF